MQHEVGSIVEGKVTGITKFGAFVELEGGSVGMVHISEISQSYVNDISEYLKEGETVKVKVLNIGDDGKISLSIKRAQAPAPNQAPFQRREGGGGSRPTGGNNGGANRPSRPQGQGNFNRNNNGGNRGGYNSRPAPTKENSFEDMLSKFIKSSDEKFSGMKQPERRRGGHRKDNSRDYD